MKGLESTVAILVATAVAITVGAGFRTASGEPPWERALNIRSEALNEKYGLGEVRRTAGTGQPSWLRALMIRSEALNEMHGLGRHSRTLASKR